MPASDEDSSHAKTISRSMLNRPDLVQETADRGDDDHAAIVDESVAHEFADGQVQEGALRAPRAVGRTSGVREDALAHFLHGVQIEHADARFRPAAGRRLHAHLGDVEQAMQKASLGVDVLDARILDLPHVAKNDPS